MSTARIPDGTPLGLVQVGLASYVGQSTCAYVDMSIIPQEGRSDPPVKPTSEVAHQPGQQPAAINLTYADPPYLGYCGLYGHRHEAPWGCWDNPQTHGELLAMLDGEYDGWAYSLTAPSLPEILPYARGPYRVAAWVKPFAAFKRNVRCAYTWEPVIFRPGRDQSAAGAPVTRDHLAEPITLKRGLTGAKPDRFNRWVLDLLGYIDGDTFTDLFPGTGSMERTRAQGVLL